MRPIAVVTLLVLSLMPFTVRAQHGGGDPAAVTKAAYQTAMAHFGFTPETVEQERPFLTPDLYAALKKKAGQPVAKGDAPDIEGDVLFNAQDVPNKYVVGDATIDGIKATVHVTLHWGDEKRHYVVQMIQTKGGWKIADVDYGKDGKLSALLK